jgi:carboxylesterase type B
MAMFDMMEGLNWVHRYISYFGGDASRITIGGESAGGWSVSWLTMSPMSQRKSRSSIVVTIATCSSIQSSTS